MKILAVFQSIYSHPWPVLINRNIVCSDFRKTYVKYDLIIRISSDIEKHADTMQHSFDFGQMAYFVPGIGYQYSNGLSDSEGENKENFKSHASPIPAPRTSLLMKQSNSQSMSVPPLDLSALAQITPSTTTTASAAVVGVPKSSTSQSSFEANSLSTKPFLSAIITEMKSAKAEDSSAGTYAIATGTSSQDNEKTELKDAKTTCEVDLCSMPSEFRPASLDGPTTNSGLLIFNP